MYRTFCSDPQHVNVINVSADAHITNQLQLGMFSECVQCVARLRAVVQL